MVSYVFFTAAAFAFIAAAFWFYAAFGTDVYLDDGEIARGDNVATEGGRRCDLAASVVQQTTWSGYAAIAAGIATVLQAIGLLMMKC